VRGLSADELQILADTMEKREFAPQTTLCREGEPGDRMWLLLRGTVSVCLNAPDRRRMRIASLGRGTTVGEMSLVETSVRSADIIADETVVCYELTRDAFDRVLLEHPTIGSRLLANLVKEIAGRLRRTSSELIAQA
jgi:CRP-like cAMP-binding protein